MFTFPDAYLRSCSIICWAVSFTYWSGSFCPKQISLLCVGLYLHPILLLWFISPEPVPQCQFCSCMVSLSHSSSVNPSALFLFQFFFFFIFQVLFIYLQILESAYKFVPKILLEFLLHLHLRFHAGEWTF